MTAYTHLGGVTYNAADAIGSLTKHSGKSETSAMTPLIAHSLTSEGHDASEHGTGRGTPLVTHALTTAGRSGGPTTEDGTGRGVPLVAGTVRSHMRPGSNSFDAAHASSAVRRLTPIECCRLQGFPDDWLGGNEPPDSPKYAALGDAVTVPVAEWIGRRLLPRGWGDQEAKGETA